MIDKLSKICSECPRTKPCRKYLLTNQKIHGYILSSL